MQMHKEPQACASASLKFQFLTADLFKSIKFNLKTIRLNDAIKEEEGWHRALFPHLIRMAGIRGGMRCILR